MSLFVPLGHFRPNKIYGMPYMHQQGRNLIHWLPGVGSDPFIGGDPFVGSYLGVNDITGLSVPKEAFNMQKVYDSSLPGTLFYTTDTAYHQSAIVFVPMWNLFRGAAVGGYGATLSAWVKLKVATPVDGQYTGLCSIHQMGGGIANTHYTWTDGTIYCGIFRGDRISFSPRSDVDRTEWHHIAVTHTGYVWRFYQNAKLTYEDFTGDGNVYVNNSGSSYCSIHGAWSEGSYVLNGHSCDWRLYNRAFSEGEVAELHNHATRWSLYHGV